MNEQIKNSQIQQVVERYDNEKRFKNNTSVSHQELSALDEIRESVKAIFSDYFGSVEFFHNLEDFDRRSFSDEATVSLVTITPLCILFSIFPSAPKVREFYQIRINSQVSFKNENGYRVPFDNLTPECIDSVMNKNRSCIYVHFKTERNLEDVSRIIALYFINFIKNDYHYVNIEKPGVSIIKRTHYPSPSSGIYVGESIEFNHS